MEQVLRPISPAPVFPAELQKEKVKQRVESYDVARSIAVIGMVLVNYSAIFHPTSENGVDWLVGTADFLTGRAAALFIMLAGVGVGLMAQSAFEDNDHGKMVRIRYSLLKRSFFLLVAGFFFMQVWGSDILHFYAVYLVLASWLLNCRASLLLRLAAINFLLFTALFYLMAGEVGLPDIHGVRWAVDAIDDYFFSGLYAVLPWGSFMLIGTFMVRSGLIHNRLRLMKTFFWALFTYLCIVSFQVAVGYWLAKTTAGEGLVFLEVLQAADCFPITPLFFLSSTATSIMVIAAVLLVEKVRMLQNLFSVLKDMGRFTLTIYVGHILWGQGVHQAVKHLFFLPYSHMAFQVSVFTTLILTACCARYWAKHFRYGPLEWLLRSLTCSI